jgi:hypothetical protein
MIKGTCVTNIDEGRRKEWPTVFAAVPRIGDSVRAEGGYTLKVCRITHYQITIYRRDGDFSGKSETIPCIEIELTKYEELLK